MPHLVLGNLKRITFRMWPSLVISQISLSALIGLTHVKSLLYFCIQLKYYITRPEIWLLRQLSGSYMKQPGNGKASERQETEGNQTGKISFFPSLCL